VLDHINNRIKELESAMEKKKADLASTKYVYLFSRYEHDLKVMNQQLELNKQILDKIDPKIVRHTEIKRAGND
jgi:TATA-binding protein-associated factor Taf7